jgi:hypothetical protein
MNYLVVVLTKLRLVRLLIIYVHRDITDALSWFEFKGSVMYLSFFSFSLYVHLHSFV